MTGRAFGWCLGAVLILIGTVSNIAYVGWVSDLVVLGTLRKMSRDSLQYFTEFQKTGYEKPAYYSDMKEGEAWDFYARVEQAPQPADSDAVFVARFARGTVSDSAITAMRIVSENDSLVSLVRSGVRMNRCTARLHYEKGVDLKEPNYMRLRQAEQLLVCRGRLKEEAAPDSALAEMVDGAVFAQDLAGGDLTVIGHMFGIDCLGVSTKGISDALGQFCFGQPQLERLAVTLNTIASTWPPLSRNFEGDARAKIVSLYDPRSVDVVTERSSYVSGPFSSGFLWWWLTHLLSWRSLFSYKRAQLNAVNQQIALTQDMYQAEKEGWSSVNSAADVWWLRVRKEDEWLAVIMPNMTGMDDMTRMYGRMFQGISNARLAGVGALVESYLLNNRRWPDSLEVVKTDGLEGLLIDPMNGQPLKYSIYPGGDSVAVYSVGTNLRDDGGISKTDGEENSDIVLILRKPETP
jgi:hypothetical protein